MFTMGNYRTIQEDFFIDEALLRKIVNVVVTHSDKLDYETTLIYKAYKSDGTFLNFDSVEQVLDDDNSPKKKINRLLIELHKKDQIDNPDADEIFALDLDSGHENKIYYEINEKNRDWSFLFIDELNSQISRIKRGKFWGKIQDRSIQTLMYSFASILLGFLVFKFISFDVVCSILDTPPEDLSNSMYNLTKLILSSIMLLFSIIILSILMPVYKIADLLGSSTFYWGDEIGRYDRISNLKSKVVWVLFVGFLVSAGAGIFVSYFSNGA